MTDLFGRRAWAVVAVSLGLTATAASAQDNTPVKHDAASKSNVVGAGSGSGGGSPNTVVDPANGGVAGTGLGKTQPKGTDAGTGNSVKGPPGQGISNGTDATP